MTMTRRRFVDSHVHVWHTHEHAWYKFPQPQGFGLGMQRPFPERYLWEDYLRMLRRRGVARRI
jgi:predicted TIM-barrel fold metal-dependent hydrolase